MSVSKLGMPFEHALQELKRGERLTRLNWNGPGQYIELQVPDEGSKMTLPYVYIKTVQGDLVPWLVSQGDLLAEDWALVLTQERAASPEFQNAELRSG